MNDLRILIYKEDNLFVGQCLELDICVQSTEIDDIRRYIENQLSFISQNRTDGLDGYPPAPDEFFDAWD